MMVQFKPKRDGLILILLIVFGSGALASSTDIGPVFGGGETVNATLESTVSVDVDTYHQDGDVTYVATKPFAVKSDELAQVIQDDTKDGIENYTIAWEGDWKYGHHEDNSDIYGEKEYTVSRTVNQSFTENGDYAYIMIVAKAETECNWVQTQDGDVDCEYEPYNITAIDSDVYTFTISENQSIWSGVRFNMLQ